MRCRGFVLFLLLGCRGGPLGTGADLASDATAGVDSGFARDARGPVRKLDLLVVMDDSPGVQAEGQEEVARALLTFLDELRRGPHGMPDLHVGIVSQDLGAGVLELGGCRPGGRRGALLARAGCGLTGGATFLAIEGNGGRSNAELPLDEALRCLTSVGFMGCGYEHFLSAALRALSGAVPENARFIRSDADLAIFVHADEDDCSAPPDSDFFGTEAPMQSPSFRCALYGHRWEGRALRAEPFEAPFSTCDDDPRGGDRLLPVDDIIRSARALRPGRRLFVAGVIGVPVPGDVGRYRVRRGAADELWLDNICGEPSSPGWVGSAAPAPRLARFIATLGGPVGSLCHGPSYHAVARSLAAQINKAQ